MQPRTLFLRKPSAEECKEACQLVGHIRIRFDPPVVAERWHRCRGDRGLAAGSGRIGIAERAHSRARRQRDCRLHQCRLVSRHGVSHDRGTACYMIAHKQLDGTACEWRGINKSGCTKFVTQAADVLPPCDSRSSLFEERPVQNTHYCCAAQTSVWQALSALWIRTAGTAEMMSHIAPYSEWPPSAAVYALACTSVLRPTIGWTGFITNHDRWQAAD